MTIFYLELK